MKPITELSEMRQIQLGILRRIHQFCNENGLTYYLSHGTLIGAVRHKGFIPWDDDIDIFIPREDYEVFCSLFNNVEENKPYRLANSGTAPYYGRPMSKVFDSNTVLVELNYVSDDPIGVNIDIWPLDGFPDEESEGASHLKRIKRLQKLLYGRVVRFKACKGFVQKLGHILLLPFSSKMIVRKIERRLKTYKYADCTRVTCAVDPYKKVFQKSWFGTPRPAPFEAEEFFIPDDPDKVLSTLYGEYMDLPPEDMQKPHHVTNAYWRQEQ